jgi:hypothetical protein
MPFADLNLARRLEAAHARGRAECAQAQAGLRPEAGVAVERVAGGYAICNPLGSPSTQAHAFGLGLEGPVGDADLERMEAFYRTRRVPAHVELCPLADPSLPQLLAHRGYRLEGWTNVLVRALLGDPLATPLPCGVKVRQVGLAEAGLWAQVIAQGFCEREEVTPEEVGISLPLFYAPRTTCFLGLVDEQPAGGGAVAMHQGVATLFGASTLLACRQRGVQAALLQARLTFSAAVGCDLATTNTEPGSRSQRNAERQGFRVVYTRALMTRVGM